MKRLATLFVVILLSTLGGSSVLAQSPYGGTDLPAGVLSITVGGNPAGLSMTTVVGQSQFQVCGKLEQVGGTAQVSLDGVVLANAPVASDGAFCAQVTAPSATGVHALFVNGKQVGRVSIGAPNAPNTGSGVLAKSDLTSQLVASSLAILMIIGGAGLIVIRRRRAD